VQQERADARERVNAARARKTEAREVTQREARQRVDQRRRQRVATEEEARRHAADGAVVEEQHDG